MASKLVEYEGSDASDVEDPVLPPPSSISVPSSAPIVLPKFGESNMFIVAPTDKEVYYNPKVEELYRPEIGPLNARQASIRPPPKNLLTGFAEAGEMDAFQFETQRRTYLSFGYALDPSCNTAVSSKSYVGDVEKAIENKGEDVVTAVGVRPLDKRRRETNYDPSNIDGFKGPWGGFKDEFKLLHPTPEQLAIIQQWKEIEEGNNPAKRIKPEVAVEKSTLHVEDDIDYQGRSFMEPPLDVGINYERPVTKCFLPKKCIHTWTGHTKGVNAIRFIPQTAHLLLSASMDSKVKIWEVHGKRRCIRTYMGHSQAVRDICFSNDGKKFLTASFDRFVKLWDTETGVCISTFTTKKIPYCVKFNPDEDKQHLIIAGMQDKKMVCWDTNTGDVVQEYDRHLGAVNTITFVEENRRLVTTSDDKSIRIWEWDVPVDTKYIADPGMHSMPAVAVHPTQKWMIMQSLNNTIMTFDAFGKFRQHRKKNFRGHMCAGYAIQMDFSPDGEYVISGDGGGHLCIWDWTTTRMYSKIKAHDDVCIDVKWNPFETSKVATAGWDGVIKYWD